MSKYQWLAGILLLALVGFVAYTIGDIHGFNRSLNNKLPPDTPSTFLLPPTNSPPSENPEVTTIQGKYLIYNIGIAPNVLCFYPSAESSLSSFCFTNQEEAKAALHIENAGQLGKVACDSITGIAQIDVSNVQTPGIVAESLASAKLVKVNKVIQPATCQRGNS